MILIIPPFYFAEAKNNSKLMFWWWHLRTQTSLTNFVNNKRFRSILHLLAVEHTVRIDFSNTRSWFGWSFFNYFTSQVVTMETNFNISGKTRVSAYKGVTADDISKPSIFLCRHRTISTSESRLTTYYSSHILSKHLRVVYAVTKSISSLVFISLRLRSARTETGSTI